MLDILAVLAYSFIQNLHFANSLVLEIILMFTPGIRSVGNVPQIFLNSCTVGIFLVWSVLRIQPVLWIRI
jgi:hypothetical protein